MKSTIAIIALLAFLSGLFTWNATQLSGKANAADVHLLAQKYERQQQVLMKMAEDVGAIRAYIKIYMVEKREDGRHNDIHGRQAPPDALRK